MFVSGYPKNQAEEKAELITSYGYFQGHKCSLSTSKITNYEMEGGRMKQFIYNLVTVNADDIRARNMFR